MYALIYDEYQLDRPQKKVISTHASRTAAEIALEKRQEELGRKVWECNTRIVWVERETAAGDTVGPGEYESWRPGEEIPEGEDHADSD
jgi:hypothetical protein